MPLDFPAAPIPGDVFVLPDGSEVVYDGEKWTPPGTAYLPIAGGTMLGPILLEPPYPLNQYEAGHKQYIDEMIAAQSLYQGLWQVAANTPDLDPAVALPLAGFSWLAQTVDQNIPELAPANLPGIGGQPINAGDSVRWNAQAAIYERVRGASMGSVEAMLLFVKRDGDRMTGALVLADGPITQERQATTKRYVDQISGRCRPAVRQCRRRHHDRNAVPAKRPDCRPSQRDEALRRPEHRRDFIISRHMVGRRQQPGPDPGGGAAAAHLFLDRPDR